ncbi:Cytochrome C oxidase, cbb3-type, subunit III [Mucilaginibacter pineti]|uniref:Cytochrome C oxidase, cbb3-type, subunit III n=1 Tax=Mucilaginibacter pineti TaxID=1391627 RepID=A0A1G6TGJ7_9SPHI|nr:cytochrome c [Mucilaginibacter pineti]SDD28139.1 Cytochrome C oxidase, cbb3-type, subunit III [Mucilaginibacter pineti]
MKFKIIGFITLVLIVFAISCQNDGQVEFNRYYSGGSQIYQSHCQNCHGAKGEGLQALIPPLTDSIYLNSNKTALACYVKNGLKGKITIHNKVFDEEMPSSDLSPIEIAKVLTYVTNSFGNKMGTINLEQVTADLGKCK